MSGINIASIPRISAPSLAELLKPSSSSAASVSVIDVRDTDYIGGHIINSTNLPTSTHDYKIPELVRTLQDTEIVVFHCALSQQRGPGAALKYLRERERMVPKQEKEGRETESVGGVENKSVPQVKGQKVYVLDGGFVKWQELYGEDKELTEDYQKDIWEFGY